MQDSVSFVMDLSLDPQFDGAGSTCIQLKAQINCKGDIRDSTHKVLIHIQVIPINVIGQLPSFQLLCSTRSQAVVCCVIPTHILKCFITYTQ